MAQAVDPLALRAHLMERPRCIYAGFDPTAPSLHIGHLVPLLALRRAREAGHIPIAVIGGATGLIGDPSLKATERQLLDRATVVRSCEAIQRQVCQVLELDGSNRGRIVNNLEWTDSLDLVEFLRDRGKHFSVNAMIRRDSVRARLERERGGISFTEFSYMLLQANDFLELCKRHDCSVQLGGSDQWGNIVSGIDLIRRVLNRQVFGITLPLITKSDGEKFGKTESGATWLDSGMTSPYSFHQFWMNVQDSDLPKLIRYFSLQSSDRIDEIVEASARSSQLRIGQRELATELTELVHGKPAVLSAERISRALFKAELEALSETDLEQLELDGLECVSVQPGTEDVQAASVALGLAKSRSEVRRLVQSGGLSLNGAPVRDAGCRLRRGAAFHGRFHLLRRGKKAWAMAVHR